jgi:hypothetical protein
MHMPFAIHARAGLGFPEQVDEALFENAGTDAAQHVFRRFRFQDDRVDSLQVQ